MTAINIRQNLVGGILASVLCLLWLSSQLGLAQEAFSNSTNAELPATTANDAAIIGKIVYLGDPSPGATDMAVFHGIKIKVDQVLGGAINANSSDTITVSYEMDMHEQPPNVGGSYVFLVHKGKVKVQLSKLLPETDFNVAKVKALFVAASARK